MERGEISYEYRRTSGRCSIRDRAKRGGRGRVFQGGSPVLPSVTDVFDFARFSFDDDVAEDGHVVAVFNIGVTGTDAIIKIVDHWTVRDGKATSRWAAYFEPQAVLGKLGIKLAV